MVPWLTTEGAVRPPRVAVAPASTVNAPALAPPLVPTSIDEVESNEAPPLRAPSWTFPPPDADAPPVRVPATTIEPPAAAMAPLAEPLSLSEPLDCTVRVSPEATARPPVENLPDSVTSPPMVSWAELPVPVITWGS